MNNFKFGNFEISNIKADRSFDYKFLAYDYMARPKFYEGHLKATLGNARVVIAVFVRDGFFTNAQVGEGRYFEEADALKLFTQIEKVAIELAKSETTGEKLARDTWNMNEMIAV